MAICTACLPAPPPLTPQAEGQIYAMKFPSEAELRSFSEKLNDCVFYNTYGLENDDVGRAKQFDKDYSGAECVCVCVWGGYFSPYGLFLEGLSFEFACLLSVGGMILKVTGL